MHCFHPKQSWFSQSLETKEALCENTSPSLGKPVPVGAQNLAHGLDIEQGSPSLRPIPVPQQVLAL